MSAKAVTKLIAATEKHGWLLVFPLPKKKRPLSLWHILYPRSEMRWEWDAGGDNRVAALWHMRRELAESGKVIYAKYYRGRATVFSKTYFQNLWVATKPARAEFHGEAREILELLETDSPLSTKQIRRAVDLTGKENEKRYHAAMKQLWMSHAIVGVGEIDDGAFPSLAHAATHVVFEDLCTEAERTITDSAAKAYLERVAETTGQSLR